MQSITLRNGQWCKFRPTNISVACGAHGESEQPPDWLLVAIADRYHRAADGLVVGIFVRGSWQTVSVGPGESQWIPDRIVPVERDSGASFEWGGGHVLSFVPATVEALEPLDYRLPEHLSQLPQQRVAHLTEAA